MQKEKPRQKIAYVVEEIPINLIDYAEQQIRTEQVDDDIHELASSIQSVDLLQVPGVVRTGDRFALAWGRRRLEALRLLGYDKIPCRVYDGRMSEIKALALVENLQRRQMSVQEEVEAVRFLAEDKKMPIDLIVAALGRSRSYVMTRLAVPQFKEEVRTALVDGTIGIGAAEILTLCESESNRRYFLSQVAHKQLNISELRACVQQSNQMPTQDDAINEGIRLMQSPISEPTILFACSACGQAKAPNRMIFVRVCGDGCSTDLDTTPPGIYTPEEIRDGKS